MSDGPTSPHLAGQLTAADAAGLSGLPDPGRALVCPCDCHEVGVDGARAKLHDGGASCLCQTSPDPAVPGGDPAAVQLLLARSVADLLGHDRLVDVEAAVACGCFCHTRRFGAADRDYHDQGSGCVCQMTEAQLAEVEADRAAKFPRRPDPTRADLERARADVDAGLGVSGLRDIDAALACQCSCHTRRFGQPTSDSHDGGVSCQCQQTPEERAAARDEMLAWLDEARAAAEEAESAEAEADRAADWAELVAVADQLGIGELRLVSELFPTVIQGTFDGRYFHYRERGGNVTLRHDGPDGEVVGDNDGGLEGALRHIASLLTAARPGGPLAPEAP